MSEKTFRKYLRDILVAQGAAVSQVESHETSAGIPDTSVCFKGADSWAELKFATDKKQVVVRKSQKVWFRDRLKAGATNLFVGVRYETKDKVFNAVKHITDRADLEHRDPKWWVDNADLVWASGDDKWYVEPLMRMLGGKQ